MTDLTIRAVTEADRAHWQPLWDAYLAYYQTRVTAEHSDLTFQRVIGGKEINGFLAVDAGGEVLGLVHYLFHASTWTAGPYCYLQDLFVVPAARGRRVGRRLIAAVETAARARGASRVYWLTEEFNGEARRLYERVAKRSPFLQYVMKF